jgi:hypothetical protein
MRSLDDLTRLAQGVGLNSIGMRRVVQLNSIGSRSLLRLDQYEDFGRLDSIGSRSVTRLNWHKEFGLLVDLIDLRSGTGLDW